MVRRKGPTPRLEDVARRAQVHSSTVSRFFSKPDLVAPQTAARIRHAAEELGYVPDLLAGSLASNKRRLAALLVPDLAYANFNEAIEQITSGLTAAGTNVMLGITGGSIERCDQLVTAALRWRVDAVIAWTALSRASARLLRGNGVTVLEICDASSELIDVGLGFNETEAGQALADYVRGKGYRRPFFVGTRGPFSVRRGDAFRDRWLALTGEIPIEEIIDLPANFHQGRAIFTAITGYAEPPDVIVCPSDYLAQAVIVEALAAGLSVPQDLAVIGFGNTPMAADMRPAMTSVDLHSWCIPDKALQILDARARGETVPGRHFDVGFEIVARESG